MFSKEWLEQCSQSITSYETPAKVVDSDDEIEDIDEKEKETKIQIMLKRMKKRRGEEEIVLSRTSRHSSNTE